MKDSSTFKDMVGPLTNVSEFWSCLEDDLKATLSLVDRKKERCLDLVEQHHREISEEWVVKSRTDEDYVPSNDLPKRSGNKPKMNRNVTKKGKRVTLKDTTDEEDYMLEMEKLPGRTSSSSSLSSSYSSATPSPLIPATILLLLCIPGLFYLAPQILPPPPAPPVSFPDELEDLSLFRRAIAVETHTNKPKSRLGATNSKPKIAFLFLTNTDLHFSPLWERFFNGNKSNRDLYTLYVHADPTVNPKIRIPGGAFSEDRFITAKKTYRGTPTLIAAARRLLATALLDDPSNQFFTLISQYCIPLHSFNFFYDALFETKSHQVAELRQLKYKSFIEIVSDAPYIRARYNARGENVMVPEVPFDKFRMGSQFFTLTRKHSLLVVSDRRLWKKFRLPCLKSSSCYPEEHYFPTLLSMEDPKGCTSYTLTRVNWTNTVNGHPHTYFPPEVSPELIYILRRSNVTTSYMFARKFSPDCLEPLMNMANDVIFQD